ncbi:MAG: hypothetical protein AAFX10_05355 [Pseudomonadota bacterium]
MKRYRLLLLALCAGCSAGDPGAGNGEPSTAEKAIEELRQQYEDLAGDGFDDPVRWAAEDIENIGDWDYRVLDIEAPTASDFEAALNELGDDRWEAFWVEPRQDGYRVLLRKPSISYLSKVPLSQLGRLIIPAPEQAE